jgi:hypothetical protein
MTQSNNPIDPTNPHRNGDATELPPPPNKPPLEAVLTAIGATQSFRPPPPNSLNLTPKLSSAPPPVIRPHSPAPRNKIGLSSRSSATQEIASAISRGRWQDAIEPAKRAPTADPLHLRRTVIPILLTAGVIFAAAAAMLTIDFQDNALADLFPKWAPIGLLVLAGISLALAALNMLSVRNALRRKPLAPAPKPR